VTGLPSSPPLPLGGIRLRALLSLGAAVSLVAVVACGAAIALSGIGAPRLVGDLGGWAAPLFRSTLVHVTRPQFYLLLLVMSAGYLGVLAFAGHLRVRWIVAAIVALHVAFLLAPPLLSSDIFSYLSYARLGTVHHLDPYVAVPAARPLDPVYQLVRWRHTLSVYGPLFTLASYPLGRLAPADALLALKLAMAAASLGCVALVWQIAGRLGRPQPAAIAIFGLNPLLLVWTVGGGHNDLLMLLGMLGAFALVVRRREALGGAALVAAVAVKASAGLAIPFLVLSARRRLRTIAGIAVGAVLVAFVATIGFSDHALGMLSVLRHEQSLVSRDSVPHDVARLLGLLGVPSGVRTAFTALFGAALVAALIRAWRGGDSIAACGWAYVALVTSSLWLLAWYTVWPLPFAALAAGRRRGLLIATFALQVFFVGTRFHLS
jgi:alpha-1,6-mannosyltransferase